ncbi:hypothetical protein ABZ589_14665 [Streptomyces sp. NPDC013313]|uniref:hypothetical protein n=1 Tax=Streptomyces sp. NPDC013313 TaxID=3155603 RepID=UPI0033C9B468
MSRSASGTTASRTTRTSSCAAPGSPVQSDVLGGCDPASLGEVILDEMLPAPAGCTHEPARRPGTLVVACRDLVAEWVPADCPDPAPHG